MAQIKIEDETVVIRLSRAEKFGALHGDLRFPRSAVRAARVVDKPFAEIRGCRCPGTGVPWVIALGTWRRRGGGRDFVAVYLGERGIVVEIDPNVSSYQRVILTIKDPDGIRNLLAAAA
jgi:hypothetical protein